MTVDFRINSKLIPLLLLSIMVALAWFFYRRTNPPVPSWLKRLLFGLRAVVLSLLVLLLFEPVFILTSTVTEKPMVALLADCSQSMALTDSQGSRQKQLTSSLASSTLDSLAQRSRLETFAFADHLAKLNLASIDSLSLTGQGTDIGRALERLNSRFEPEELSALILLSDGANNLGKDPLAVVKRIKVPIFTVGIGSPEGQRDIRLSRVLSPSVAYAGDRLPVEVTLQSWGYAGVRVTVALSEGSKELVQKYVTLAGDGREQQVRFQLPVRNPGLHRYQASISVAEGELSSQNNRQRFRVKVLDGRIRVLLVAGRPSPDFSFLRRALEREKDVEVHPLVVKKCNTFYQGRFPTSEKELRKFNLVILLDIARSVITGLPEELITDFVDQGGGLLILGGEDAFGGYIESPMRDALPVSLMPGLCFRSGQFRLELSVQGERHPVTLISENPLESQRMWAQLPPLAGINRLGGVRPGATVLAYCKDATGSSFPLLIVGGYGKGRIIVAPFCGFWRWDLVMWGIGRTNRASNRFWHNAIGWLTAPSDLSPIRVGTDKKVYRSGERVNLQVQLYDPFGQPLPAAAVIVTLTQQGKQHRQVQLKDCGGGTYRAQIPRLPPGTYQVKAVAWKEENKVGEDRGEFTVEQYSLEFQQTRADYELLKRISYQSGGKFCRAQEFPELLDELPLEKQKQRRTRSVRLYSYPWILALVLGLIAAEWAVRRRQRLL